MEGQRGQVIVLSYTTPDTKEVETYYSKNSIATGFINEAVIYDERRYYFALNKYLKGDEENYRIFYTYLEDEHQTGVAINKQEKLIVYFNT